MPRKKINKTLLFLIFIAFTVFCYSGFMIYDHYSREKQENQEYVDLQNKYGTKKEKEPTPMVSEEPEDIIKIPQYEYDWAELKVKNKDLQDWIYIPDSYIDFPVVKGNDNKYYLKHSFENEWNRNGCPFLDYRCENDSDNLIIYGHNMIGNSKQLLTTVMFSSLTLWVQDIDYFNAHDTIYLTDEENGTSEYKIFAVDLLNVANKEEYFEYINTDFETEEEWQTYIENIKKFAVFENSEVEPEYEQQILTLSTCYRPFHYDNGRLLIFAVKIEV